MINSFLGNSEIKETLKSIISSGRFPHAFIIEGAEGSGRHTLAKIIAASAVCEADTSDKPCGKCRTCELVEKNGHCDVLTYAPDGATFKVDTVREIRDNAYVMPIESKRKINILSDCDKMNEPAQNAFLKVLEEPPEFMIFILICQNASSLLPTVRSRCVTLSVSNPDITEAKNYITLKTGKPESDIDEALESSHGNVGKALEILSGEAAKSVGAAKEFLKAVKNRDRISALKTVQKFEKDRLGFTAFLSELRLIAQAEALKCAKKQSELTLSTLTRLLKTAENTELEFRRHVGQPLSISLISTCLCAEIFENL